MNRRLVELGLKVKKLLNLSDGYCDHQLGAPNIRRLVELGLKAKGNEQ